MSVGRVSDNFEYGKEYLNSSVSNQYDVAVFDDSQIDENYSELSPVDNSVSSQQVNLSNGAGVGNTTASQQEQLTQALTDYLENMVLAYEEQFQAVKDNNGWIAKGWDWFKNATGIGAGSDKVQKQIDELKKQIEELKNDPSKLNDVYKSVTGNELNDEELNNLINGQVDLSNSKIVESVSKYIQGQKMCTNIISGIASSLAVVGLIAAGVVAAPFTGGTSLAATTAIIGTATTGGTLAAIGTLTAAGTAAYMIPQAVDGLTEKDGYSFKEVMQDVSNGVVNSAFTAIGMGAGKAVGNTLGQTAINKVVAGLVESETTSLIIGDGIGIGNYLTEAAFNDDVDFSWADLGKTAAVSTASSVVAGATGYHKSLLLRPMAASGTTASSQIFGRFLAAGITGGSAAISAAAVGGGVNYLLTCAIDGKEVSFDEWVNASTENLSSAALSGFVGGMAFEAVHLAAGTPKPEGTVKVDKYTDIDGNKITGYYDKDGNLIAADMSRADFAKIFSQQEGLVEYGSKAGDVLLDNALADNTRTIRFSFMDPANPEFVLSNGQNVPVTTFDWTDNISHQNYMSGNFLKNTNTEVVYDATPQLNGNIFDTPQLTQGTPLTQDSGLVPLSNDTGAEYANPNSQNIDLIVDTTLVHLAAQQAQLASVQAQAAGVQAQAQGAVISADTVAAGVALTAAGSNNIPPVQSNPHQFGGGSNPPVQIQPMEETGSGNAASLSVTETSEPQLPPPEEVERRIAFLEENFPDIEIDEETKQEMLSISDAEFEECVNDAFEFQRRTLYLQENFPELDESTRDNIIYMDLEFESIVEFLEQGITDVSTIKEIMGFPKEQQPRAIDLSKLGIGKKDLFALSQSRVIYERAVKAVTSGITSDLVQITSSEDQLTRAIDLQEFFNKQGVNYENYIAKFSMSKEITDFAKLCVENGTINFNDIDRISTLAKDELPLVSDCIREGITNIDLLEEICSMDKDQISRIIILKKLGKEFGMSGVENDSRYDKYIIKISSSEELTNLLKDYLNAGITNYELLERLMTLPKEQQYEIMDLKKQGYNIFTKPLQNGAGTQFIARMVIDTKTITGEAVEVVKTIIINPDGTINKSTAEVQGDKTETWYYGQDRTVILNKINDGRDIASQIEIVNNEDGEPSYILYTKASETLEGAYETTRYDLSDYPENMDVIEAIENGTIQGGQVLSSVSSENGVTQYQENYEYENSNISRNYTQEVDETGEIISSKYKYDITDTEGKQLLSIERSWSKNSDGTTTTTINGKKYTASFDEDTMIVTVTQDDGSSVTIDFQSKLSPYDPNNNFQKTTFGDEETMQRAFFEFVKTMPADLLINLSNFSQIDLVDSSNSLYSYKNHTLSTGFNLGMLSHEIGHSIDFATYETGHLLRGEISFNKELIDIYNEEFKSFMAKYPDLAQEIIKYFSPQKGGSCSTGLSELVAEANMLMTTYGININQVETRSEYLVRYFPNTVAKIAELLGYNN